MEMNGLIESVSIDVLHVCQHNKELHIFKCRYWISVFVNEYFFFVCTSKWGGFDKTSSIE